MDHSTETQTVRDTGAHRSVPTTGRVCAIVVTHNRAHLLQECIEALRCQTRPPDQILVVDNGSTDETASWLSGQRGVEVVTQANLGCAGGFFSGIKHAFIAGFDWLWCMDDDCICEPSALASLLEALPRLPHTPGFLCGRPLNTDGNTVNTPDIDMRISRNGILFWDQYLEQGMIKARRASFVSVMFSRQAVATCGLPVAEMFIWGEDAEYTLRISRQFDSYYVFSSRVLHKRNDQSGRLDIVPETNPARISKYHHYYRNGLFYRGRGYGWKEVVKFLLKCLSDAVKVAKSDVHRRAKLWAIVRGCAEYPFFRPRVRFANIAGKNEVS